MFGSASPQRRPARAIVTSDLPVPMQNRTFLATLDRFDRQSADFVQSKPTQTRLPVAGEMPKRGHCGLCAHMPRDASKEGRAAAAFVALPRHSCNFRECVVGPAGLEPATQRL